MAERRLPALAWLQGYRRDWLRFDLVAGLTLWAIATPQTIAYAQIGGLPPHTALYAVLAGALVYAMLGTSRQIVVAPTSSAALLAAALLTTLATAGSARYFALAAALAIVGGVILLLFGWLKLGFVSQLVAPSVQIGFLFGIGLVIVLVQVGVMLDIPIGDGFFWQQLALLASNVSQTNPWTLAVGAAGLAALLLLGRFAPRAPGALIVIAVSIAGSILFDLQARGVPVIGFAQGGLPVPALPIGLIVEDWFALVPVALAIVVIGYTESITIAQEFAAEHRYEVSPDQELTALGASNLLAGILQGFSVTGVISLSHVNNRAGARTPVSLLVVAVLTAVTLLVLLPLFAALPVVTLAAIIMRAMFGLLNVRELRRFWRLSGREFVTALIALFGVLIFGVLPGLLGAIALSLVMLVTHDSRPRTAVLGQAPGTPVWVDRRRFPGAATDPRVLIFRLDSALRFVNANWMSRHLRDEVRAAGETLQWILIDLQNSYELDIRGLDVLERVRQELDERGMHLALVNVHPDVRMMLERSGNLDGLGAGNVFRTIDEAMAAIHPVLGPGTLPDRSPGAAGSA